MDPDKIKQRSEKAKEIENKIGFSYNSLMYLDSQVENSLSLNFVVLEKLKENLSNLKNSSLPNNIVEPIIKEMIKQINNVEHDIECAKDTKVSIEKNINKYKEAFGW